MTHTKNVKKWKLLNIIFDSGVLAKVRPSQFCQGALLPGLFFKGLTLAVSHLPILFVKSVTNTDFIIIYVNANMFNNISLYYPSIYPCKLSLYLDAVVLTSLPSSSISSLHAAPAWAGGGRSHQRRPSTTWTGTLQSFFSIKHLNNISF